MGERYKIDFSQNPTFDTVEGLSNITFNPDQIVEGRMATEDQIAELERRYTEVEARRNECCRDIVVWKSFTRIVSPDGIVISPFVDNYMVGTARRGMPFTVTFSPAWKADLYEDYRSYPTNYTGTNAGSNPFGNNFEIRIPNSGAINMTSGDTNASSEAPQVVREAVEYLLINTSSSKVASSPDTAMLDVEETLPDIFGGAKKKLSALTGVLSKKCSVNNADTCGPERVLPLYTTYGGDEGSYFYTYRKSDGTLSIDVKDRNIFRGLSSSHQDDPAYLMIFCTQFVTKRRA